MQEDILLPKLFRIAKKKQETPDAFSIDLTCVDSQPLSFFPGQFNMLYVFGIGEVPISLSGGSKNSHYSHTIKIVGKVTAALHRLEPGDLVGARGPFGSSWPVERLKRKNLVLIAGGIGLAPLRPLIVQILENRSDFEKIQLLYGARDPKDLLFREDFEAWSRAFDGCHITVDFAEEEWKGNVGVVTNLIPYITADLKNSVALVCGPEVMMRFTIRELLQRGMESRAVFLSMERNMKCAIGHCGRCQYVANFICKDGPVLPYETVQPFFEKKEI